MITGKTKEEFLQHVSDEHGNETYQYIVGCLLLEDITAIWGYLLKFFDSVGIYITLSANIFKIGKWDTCLWQRELVEKQETFSTILGAQIEAIKKANEINNGRE